MPRQRESLTLIDRCTTNATTVQQHKRAVRTSSRPSPRTIEVSGDSTSPTRTGRPTLTRSRGRRTWPSPHALPLPPCPLALTTEASVTLPTPRTGHLHARSPCRSNAQRIGEPEAALQRIAPGGLQARLVVLRRRATLRGRRPRSLRAARRTTRQRSQSRPLPPCPVALAWPASTSSTSAPECRPATRTSPRHPLPTSTSRRPRRLGSAGGAWPAGPDARDPPPRVTKPAAEAPPAPGFRVTRRRRSPDRRSARSCPESASPPAAPRPPRAAPAARRETPPSETDPARRPAGVGCRRDLCSSRSPTSDHETRPPRDRPALRPASDPGTARRSPRASPPPARAASAGPREPPPTPAPPTTPQASIARRRSSDLAPGGGLNRPNRPGPRIH